MDLFQEGLLGLDRAIDKFDYRKGYTFATYAANWINQAIVSFIHKNSATVTTRERSHGARLVSQIREDFQLRFGRQPTPEEICRIGRITPSAFERYSSQPIVVTAYEPSIGNDVPLEELHIESWSDTSEIDAVLDLCMAIEDLNLTPIERQVMEMKFGFGEYMPNSISDISRAVHRSTRQVENILKQIVDRLRSHDLIAISAED
jgi:RNA polymerase nonessential primary-like sigma factor